MSDIQLVFANYHCATDISECIGGLFDKGAAVPLDIVVVENGGAAIDAAKIQLPCGSTLRALSPGANIGYFGAMSMAIQHAPGKDLLYRVLCNPDLEFRDPTFFTRLLDLSLERRSAVIAPSILSTRNAIDQNPYLCEPPSAALLRRWKVVYSSWAAYVANDLAYSVKAVAMPRKRRPSVVAPGPIHAPHGAMMVFAETFLQQERMLKQVPFLFAEELFIGEICRRNDWLVRYEPSLRVWHREHATTGVLASKRRFQLQREAMQAFDRFTAARGATSL